MHREFSVKINNYQLSRGVIIISSTVDVDCYSLMADTGLV